MKIAAAFTCLVIASPATAYLDFYIGTITIEDQKVILTRCDIAQNRYILVDDPKGKNRPVADIAATRDFRSGFAYGEVIGEYREHDGANELIVSTIDNLTPGRSCHLVDPIR